MLRCCLCSSYRKEGLKKILEDPTTILHELSHAPMKSTDFLISNFKQQKSLKSACYLMMRFTFTFYSRNMKASNRTLFDILHRLFSPRSDSLSVSPSNCSRSPLSCRGTCSRSQTRAPTPNPRPVMTPRLTEDWMLLCFSSGRQLIGNKAKRHVRLLVYDKVIE